MPDYYDVSRLDVRAEPAIPIVWQTLPDLVHEDSEQRQVRSRNFVNAPANETRFQLASGYTLPTGWTYRGGGRLRYRAILGQTIRLKFTATRAGVPNVDSNEFTITRQQAFIERLVPDRIVVGLGFNNTTQRVYVINSTDIDVSPVRRYINAFNIEGVEQVTESLDVTPPVGAPALAGGTFDGTHFWLCGTNEFRSESYLVKVNTDGTQNASYTVSQSPIQIESLTFDGTYIWGLDLRNRQLRKFSTSGVEQSGAITLPRATHTGDYTGYYFADAQYGLAYADNHFWIPQHHISAESWIFCCTTAGVRVRSRDVATEHAVSGVTYNPTTDNLWWIYDREDGDGNRYGILEAQQI